MSLPNIYLPTSEELSELSLDIHNVNVSKGFWDEPNLIKLLMLAAGELFEAVEADRKGRFARPGITDTLQRDLSKLIAEGTYPSVFEELIKDTYWDEIADCVIRCMDIHVGISGKVMVHDNDFSAVEEPYGPHECLVEALIHPSSRLVKCAGNHSDLFFAAHTLKNVVVELFHFAYQQKAPLWDYINLKVAYNRTRPRLHGKAY